MTIDKERQLARWRRNAKSRRERLKEASPESVPLPAEMEARIWAERDKRLQNFPWSVWDLKPGRYYPRQTKETTYPFICDVWAAITILELQEPGREVSTRLISSFLWERGKDHGVQKSSLRTKIKRARVIIDHLEDAPSRDFKGKYWPKFPDSVADHGSGLKQHVDMVMASLGLRTQDD